MTSRLARYGIVLTALLIGTVGISRRIHRSGDLSIYIGEGISFAAETPKKKSESPSAQSPQDIFVKLETEEEPKKEKGKKFEDLHFFAYASGLTGIFDKSTGKLYVYDTNLANCIAIRQLHRLGDPMRAVK